MNNPNPFWSEELQRRYLETAADEEQERPADLSRYDSRNEGDERQTALEPPYEATAEASSSGHVGLDQGTRELLDEEPAVSEVDNGGRPGPGQPLLARVETRADLSESKASVRTAASKREQLALVSREASEPELLAERAAGREGQGYETNPLTTSPSPFPMEQMMLHLGSMVQQAIHQHVTPAISQVLLQQAKVESRLDQLEVASRGPSADGEGLVERTRLLDISGFRTERAPTLPQGTSAAEERPRSSSVHTQPAGLSQREGPALESDLAGGKSGEQPSRSVLPTQGSVIVGGRPYAWQVSAGGLQLVSQDEGLLPNPRASFEAFMMHESERTSLIEREERRDVPASVVLDGRAHSPFQRTYAATSDPGGEWDKPVGPPRALRPTTSEPQPIGQLGRQSTRSPPKGSQAAEQLVAQPAKTPSFAYPYPGRPVTPYKPRIVYPISPGGTEIRPPPPQPSPKRTTRSSPSPSRAKASTVIAPKSSAPENDLQRLTAVLEGAFRANRGGDSEGKVEDVKAVPELPKLEIKDSEREITPLIAGDWLALIGPSLRDLSAHASQWWQESLGASQAYYAKWLESTPIERLLVRPDRPGRFESGQFSRVEQRAISLLLKAIPAQVKEDVVATRKMSSNEIIGNILTTYQPGGLRERTALLKYLTSPETTKTASEALKGVRRWMGWRNRAAELNIAIPDATLLIGGLDLMTGPVLAQFPEATFRLQTLRHQNSVDHVPTQEKATSLGQMLQSCRSLSMLPRIRSLNWPGCRTRLRMGIRRMPGTRERKGTPKGKAQGSVGVRS